MQWLTICLISLGREFQTEGAAWENERCPNVLVFMCGMRRVLESKEERSFLMESRHGEGQTDEQGLYQRKRSDRVLTTYIRYVLGWAASEEF